MRMTLCDCFVEVYPERAAEKDASVARVKFVGRDADKRARGPSILWWVFVPEREPLIDGAAPPNGIGFRIECRAEEIAGSDTGAARLLECALERLGPHLIAIEAQYDEDDSPSQQRLDYFACVARLILPEEIEIA